MSMQLHPSDSVKTRRDVVVSGAFVSRDTPGVVVAANRGALSTVIEFEVDRKLIVGEVLNNDLRFVARQQPPPRKPTALRELGLAWKELRRLASERKQAGSNGRAARGKRP